MNAQVDRNVKSRELKEALELLETADVVTRSRQTIGAKLPLSTGVNEEFFKVLFLDVDLMHAITGIYSETAKGADYTAIFRGAVAKQFSGQELLSCQSPYTRAEMYYWGSAA